MPILSPTINDTYELTGVTAVQRPELNGLALYDQTHTVQIESIDISLQTRVVRSNTTGMLDFYYRFTPLSDTHNELFSFDVIFNLPGLVFTFADFRPDGLGTLAPFACATAGTPHNEFGFVFPGTIPKGTSTRFFFISTNTKSFSPTVGILQLANMPIPGPTGL